jgi:hypothetical protein
VVYPVLSAGQRITAGLLTEMLPLSARKTTSTQRTNTTTLTNDPELVVTLAVGGVYEMTGKLLYRAHSSADLRVTFSGPLNSFVDYTAHGLLVGASGTTGDVAHTHFWLGNQLTLGGAAAENTTQLTAFLHGYVNAGAGGPWALQWAQNTANAVGTILVINSFLTYRRIA